MARAWGPARTSTGRDPGNAGGTTLTRGASISSWTDELRAGPSGPDVSIDHGSERRLYKKAKGHRAKPVSEVLMESRHRSVVSAADGSDERDAADDLTVRLPAGRRRLRSKQTGDLDAFTARERRAVR